MYPISVIYSSTDRNLHCFHLLTIMNDSAINCYKMLLFLCSFHVDIFHFSWVYIPSSEIAGSKSNSTFNHLSIYQAVFQSGCIILHSHQQWMRLPSRSTSAPAFGTIGGFGLCFQIFPTLELCSSFSLSFQFGL